MQSRMSQLRASPFDFIRSRKAVCHIPQRDRAETRTVTNKRIPEPQPYQLTDADRNARDDFFKIIIGLDGSPLPPEEEAERPSAACVAWFAKFLECRFRASWTTVMREALRDLWDLSNAPRPDEIGKVYSFMSVVAKSLFEVRGLAMVQIVDAVGNLGLLKDLRDPERAIPNQLVFAAVGWLSESTNTSILVRSNCVSAVAMLYDPLPVQPPRGLEIRRSVGSIPRQRTRLRSSRTFTSYRQNGFDGFDHEVFIFLRRFGRLIPEHGVGLADATQLITVSYVCFAMLDKVADIKIEWVNSLSLHLEFDNVRRVLKIFRFPSFCMLMYRDRTSISK